MNVTLNGTPHDPETACATLGDLLAAADETADRSGEIVIRVALDGKELDPDAIAALRDGSADRPGLLELESVSARELKLKSYATILEFLKLLGDPRSAPTDEVTVSTMRSYRDVFGELVEADELSYLVELEAGYEAAAAPEARARARASVEPLSVLFNERLSELTDPVRAMRGAASAFELQKTLLAEVPLKLQTGHDGEAVRNVLAFIELFNKTNRILPTLAWSGFSPESIRPSGGGLKDFYDSINGVLKEMMGAFERKDTVLLGDLVEYEIIPRMSAFYKAVTLAMEAA
ncbi:MAG: hypothetical protein NT080_05420 [Spirochaetes bacterium]|nr:hypothetical protein [Spirochaetota bacterium]